MNQAAEATELLSRLNQLLAQTELQISSEQQQQLVAYIQLLTKWNKAYNLTSVRDPMQMLVKHIVDSLVVSPHLIGQRFIDVGTGPGLPGIPLAIANPDKQFILLDSLGKRRSTCTRWPTRRCRCYSVFRQCSSRCSRGRSPLRRA